MKRDELVSFLDGYLNVGRVRDFVPNGLQVVGKPEVTRVALAVSASAEAFRLAVDEGADLVLVHHGLFWDSDSRVIGHLLRGRLKLLLDHDLTLLAYHLPLDLHPIVGNNAQASERLRLRLFDLDRPLAETGYVAEAESPVPFAEFVERVNRLFGTDSFVEPAGCREVRRVGLVSGSASRTGYLTEAVERRCDVYVTGTAAEPAPAVARELGLALIAAGHYNSEKLGVLALGRLLQERFGLYTFFVDVPNPL